MNFAEKKQAYGQLQGQEHLEADKELLLNKSPKSPVLNLATIDRNKAQRETLWALLDVASVNEITGNRVCGSSATEKEESHSDKAIDLMNVARENAIKKLIEIDLQKTTQPVLASIARSINLETPDYKAATLRPLLDEFRLNLPKEGAATEEEMIPVAAHLETVNELTEEKDALVDELEEKELENEDLQSQLEDAEAEKELLEDQLKEEKKSEASPDPV